MSDNFCEHISPSPVSKPQLIKFNEQLYKELGGNATILEEQRLASVFSGNVLLPGSAPLALVYAGHQFGNFVHSWVMGEPFFSEMSWILQEDPETFNSRGAGPTRFSRNGDGRATLSSSDSRIRHERSDELFGCAHDESFGHGHYGRSSFSRISLSRRHLNQSRFKFCSGGEFRILCGPQRLGVCEDFNKLRDRSPCPLAERIFKPGSDSFRNTMNVQASLLSQWMLLGFIHGVMNTDNMTISGETIDYGPCAFMDFYHPSTVYSAIDVRGRYAYSNQPLIAQWNLAALANTLLPLIHEDHEKAQTLAHEVIGRFEEVYLNLWNEGMARKLGLRNPLEERPRESPSETACSLAPCSAKEEKLFADLLAILETQN